MSDEEDKNGKVISFRRGEKVEQVPEPELEPDAETVASLEYMLQEVKAGRFTSIAFVMLSPDGDALTAWSSSTRIQMAGAISLLQHRYFSELSDD